MSQCVYIQGFTPGCQLAVSVPSPTALTALLIRTSSHRRPWALQGTATFLGLTLLGIGMGQQQHIPARHCSELLQQWCRLRTQLGSSRLHLSFPQQWLKLGRGHVWPKTTDFEVRRLGLGSFPLESLKLQTNSFTSVSLHLFICKWVFSKP